MRWRLRIGRTSLQPLAAVLAATVAVILAVTGVFVFRTPIGSRGDSFWRLLLSDRMTLGFVRLATVSLALYVVVSLTALAAGGRWMRALSAGGFQADEPAKADGRLVALEAQLRATEEERDQAVRLLEEYLRG